MKYSKKHAIDYDQSQIARIAAQTGYSGVVVELLMMRGLQTAQEIEAFVNTGHIEYSSPERIPGLGDAVTILKQKIKENKRIIVYGDYDVDGICGTSIFIKAFKSMGFENYAYYIPDRLAEGYGLNLKAMESLKARSADIIITVDCGISSIREIGYAYENGMEVIVTDHHSCPDVLPACTVVNPKLSADPHLHKLCGAAVALKVCEALAGPSEDFTMLAAMASIADMVPLTGENRKLVSDGLVLINRKCSIEITKLVERLSGNRRVSSIDLAFGILPAINAAGRIYKPDMCVDLLSGCASDADEIIEKLSQLNNKRKAIEEKIIDSALDRIQRENLYLGKSIILSDEDWHVGVLGIAASRIKNLYYRPVILLAKDSEIYKGSCRSVDGINIFEILNSMQELFLSFGGHASAAGITIAEDNYNEFVSRFSQKVGEYADDLLSPYKHYDMELKTSDIDYKLVSELKMLEPFGTGNPEPRFLLARCAVQSFAKMGGGKHYRAVFTNSGKALGCVRFNDVSIENTVELGLRYDLIISASINEFNGNSNVQGHIEHIKCSAEMEDLKTMLTSDDLYRVSISQLLYNSVRYGECTICSMEDLKNYLRSKPFGCLVLVMSPGAAEYLINYHQDLFDLAALSGFSVPCKSQENQIVFAPDMDAIDFTVYQYVCLITSKNYKDCNYNLPRVSNRIIINEYNTNDPYINLEVTVEELRGIYKFMLKSRTFSDDFGHMIQKKSDQWKYRIAKRIFMELDILASGENNKYYIKDNKKVELENSATYCNLMRYQESVHEKKQ